MKPSNLRLIKDRLLIKPDPIETKIGSIIIPDKYHETQETGVVVATGSGRYDEKTGQKVPMQCKVKDKILYNKAQYETIQLSGEEYFMLNDSEVLAVLS